MGKQTAFGVGVLTAIPLVSNPTPIPFGILQSVSTDESFEVKELHGSNQFPEDVGRGKAKISISAKIGAVDPLLFNNIFYGGTLTGGETRPAIAEQAAMASTVTVANAATFAKDLLVFNVTTGRVMTRVASSAATGQYSVNVATGVYSFAAADVSANHIVQISYAYTVASGAGVGSTIKVANQQTGSSPVSTQLILTNTRSTTGKHLVKTYHSVTCTSLKQDYKNDDFMVTDLQLSAYADGNGDVITFSMNGTN